MSPFAEMVVVGNAGSALSLFGQSTKSYFKVVREAVPAEWTVIEDSTKKRVPSSALRAAMMDAENEIQNGGVDFFGNVEDLYASLE